MNIEIIQLSSVPFPKYQTSGSAGVDLCAARLTEPLHLQPDQCELLGAGFAVHIKDPGYAAFILPRSGLGHKRGLILGNSVGLIDSDYQGELFVSLWNRSNTVQTINPMDRIAQLVFLPVQQVQFKIVAGFGLEYTERGAGGFGSTGVSN